MAQRIAMWLFVLALCSPLVLMAWHPETFTTILSFMIRYKLDLALLLTLDVLASWLTYRANRGGLRWLLSGIVLVLSLGACWSFASHRSMSFLALALVIPSGLATLCQLVALRRRATGVT
jgi:hypothetical protein